MAEPRIHPGELAAALRQAADACARALEQVTALADPEEPRLRPEDVAPRCAHCNRPPGSAGWVWAFDRRGRPLGWVHSAHFSLTAPRAGLSHTFGLRYAPADRSSLESAMLYVWLHDVLPAAAPGGPEWRARLILSEPTEELTPRDRRWVDSWQRGPLKLTPGELAAVLARRRELLGQFRAWVAGLDADPAASRAEQEARELEAALLALVEEVTESEPPAPLTVRGDRAALLDALRLLVKRGRLSPDRPNVARWVRLD